MHTKITNLFSSIAISLSGFAIIVSLVVPVTVQATSNTCPDTPTIESDTFTSDEMCAPIPVVNTCPLPDSLGDVTIETIGSSPEKTIQQIITDSGYTTNVNTDQLQYQVWNVTPGQEVTVNTKFLDKYSANAIVFGYYINGDINTFTPIFKKGSITGFESTPDGNIGDSFTFSNSIATSIGFAIKASNGGPIATYATQNSINSGADQAIVFNPHSDEYIVAFEDTPAGDSDFNDLVVSIELSCEEVEQAPRVCSISSNTDTKVKEIRINFGPTSLVDQASVLVTPTSITDQFWTADVDGASTDAKWIWSEDPVQDWTVDKLVTFTRTFDVVDANTSGILTLAADNAYAVYLDGNLIGFTNSASYNTATGDTLAIPSLSIGTHTLKFVVQNYEQEGDALNNPGGLIFHLTLHNEACDDNGGGGNENNPPSITLLGDSPMTITIGQTFVDPGANAQDSEDSVDVNYPSVTSGFTVVGYPIGTTTASTTYTITYKYTDSDGADSNTVTRTLYVVPGTTECSDAVDNDEDEFTDSNDSGCHTDGNVGNIDSYDPNDDNEDEDVCPEVEGVQTSTESCDEGGDDGEPTDACPETEVIETSEAECEDDGGGDDGPTDDNNPTITTTDAGPGGRSGGNRRGGGGGGNSFSNGLVLGASTECGLYLTDYIKFGGKNDPEEVKKLQSMLNELFGSGLPLSGIYDQKTLAAVNKFQLQYKDEVLSPWVAIGLHPNENVPTGYVYKTTQRKINDLYCPSLGLPIPDLSDEIKNR